MERHTDLTKLINHIWSEIEQGAIDPRHPYHAPTFGTVSNQRPSLRTVILRKVNRDERSLFFHSDRRAQKINEIQNNPRVMWHFWDSDNREQLRLTGSATLHFDDEISDQIWQNSRSKSLITYLKPLTPGTKTNQPESGIKSNFEGNEVSMGDVAAGRQYFAVVCTKIDEIDFLQLHNEGNYRAYYQWDAVQFTGNWIIP
jgi:pyridoxamine 5'-phosphate oxidase